MNYGTKHIEYAAFGRQVGYVLAADVTILLLNFIQIPILTRGLGAALYGTWSLINVTISLIVPFALLGLSLSTIRFLAAEKDKNKIREDFFSIYFIIFVSAVIFSVILFLLSDYLAAYIMKDICSSFYIKLASILILFNSTNTLGFAFFRTLKQIGLYTILNLSLNIVQIGLIIISILFRYKLAGVIVAVIITRLLFCFINLSIIFRQIGFKFPKFSHTGLYLKFGFPLTPAPAILWIIRSSDRYIISYFLGVAAAGIYSAGYTIGNYASFVLMPLGVVLYPTLVKSYDEGKLDETRRYLKNSFKYFMMIAIPSAFGLSILAKPLLAILTTSEFVPGYAVIPLVAFAAIFYSFYQIFLYIIRLVKKTTVELKLLVTSAGLNILLNVILIPVMGILGAATATLIAYGVLGILTLLVTRRYLKFDLSLPFILRSVFSSVIMVGCIWLINPKSLVLVIISIIAGIAVYLAGLLVFKALSKEELTFFAIFMKANLRKICMVK